MPADAAVDERVKEESLFSRLMKRPELGAIAGVILVTAFFLATADPAMFTLAGFMNFMSPAAQLGILAIGAALLMVGGEFDLSVGSMVAFTGLFFGACVVTFGLPLFIAIPATLVFESAGEVAITFKVEERTADGHDHSAHADHADKDDGHHDH